MNIEVFRNHCIQKKGVTEGFPFGESTLVFKVMGKLFALTDLNAFESINLKCDPEEAIILRDRFQAVKPGYHMNKNHWNTVRVNEDVTDDLIFKWVDNSYNLVVQTLTKKLKLALEVL
jgi:predicted DNA-binding protein (MmcQ/YjbR family)